MRFTGLWACGLVSLSIIACAGSSASTDDGGVPDVGNGGAAGKHVGGSGGVVGSAGKMAAGSAGSTAGAAGTKAAGAGGGSAGASSAGAAGSGGSSAGAPAHGGSSGSAGAAGAAIAGAGGDATGGAGGATCGAGLNGMVAAADPKAGLLWHVEHGLKSAYGPALDSHGNLYFQGNASGDLADCAPTLVAYDGTGHLRWTNQTTPLFDPPPPVSIVNGLVVAPSAVAYAAYTNDGQLIGAALTLPDSDNQDVGVGVNARNMIAGEAVYATNAGVLSDTFKLLGDGEITGTNVVVGTALGGVERYFVGGRGPNDRSMYALDKNATTGKLEKLWRVPTTNDAAYISGIAVDQDEILYAVDSNGQLTVFDGQTGTIQWTFQAAALAGGGVAVDAGGTAYFGVIPSDDGGDNLFAVEYDGSGTTGSPRWSKALGFVAGTMTPAISSNGTLYIGDACRTLWAVESGTGDLVWSYDALGTDDMGMPKLPDSCGDGWSSVTLGPDGTVYAVFGGNGDTPNGTLFAFQGDGSGPTALGWAQEEGTAQHDSQAVGHGD